MRLCPEKLLFAFYSLDSSSSEYLSPERSRADWHDERLSDMWALGVTFFEIATGRTPFEHEDEQVSGKMKGYHTAHFSCRCRIVPQ